MATTAKKPASTPKPTPEKSAAKASSKANTSKAAASEAETPTASAPEPAKPAAKAPAKKVGSKSAKSAARVPVTEEELLSMPEDAYMNEAQLTFFKNKLLAMREEILDNARETNEHLKENEVFADPNDRATVEEENMLEQRVRDRERKLLKKINASLTRIEEGDYGFCLETGDPIGLPRLLARPTAELSIEAQEKHERLEKLYAD